MIMLKKIKMTVSALLIISLLLCFVSCGSEAVLTYNGISINEREFEFYLATYKGKFAQTYKDFKDNSSFYKEQIGDYSAEEYLFESVVHNVSLTLVSEALFDKYKLKLPDSLKDSIDAYIDDFITEYADGSKNKFNSALAEFGINAKMLRTIYLRDEMTAAVYDYLYGENGTVGITDGDRTAYLNENYVRVRHIFVNNKYTYVYDDNGNITTTSDGQAATVPLSGDELEAKNALVAAIDESLAEGGDFDEIYYAMSEDQYYKNGYYLTRNMDFISGVVASAFDLEIGEWVKTESDYGTHYIMRLPMDESPWKDENNADFFDNYDAAVSEALFTSMLEDLAEDVERNEEILSRYSVETSPTNYRF